jgi:hypothetical protein
LWSLGQKISSDPNPEKHGLVGGVRPPVKTHAAEPGFHVAPAGHVLAMKTPNAVGEAPTGIVAITTLVAVAITDTFAEPWFAT